MPASRLRVRTHPARSRTPPRQPPCRGDAAQERMGHGRYGLCDDCTEPIDLDTLLEAPEQTLCRACSGIDEFGRFRLRS